MRISTCEQQVHHSICERVVLLDPDSSDWRFGDMICRADDVG